MKSESLQVGFRLARATIDVLDRLAKARGFPCNRSDLVREAIDLYLTELRGRKVTDSKSLL